MKPAHIMLSLSALWLSSCQAEEVSSLKSVDTTGSDEPSIVDLGYGYQREGDTIYYNRSPLKGLDVDSFEALHAPMSDWPVYKDKDHVFDFDFNQVQGADPETYQLLGLGYARDKNHVYFMGQVLEGANPETFQLIARDDDHVYFGSQEMSGLDLSSLRKLDSYYLDDDSVYHMFYYECWYSCPPMKIEGADPASFEQMDRYFARDREHVYLMGKLVQGADRATFEVLRSDSNEFYFVAKDKNHVYLSRTESSPMPELKVWEGVDAASFEWTEDGQARDKHGVYDLPSGEMR